MSKICLITGATTGIGKETAEYLANKGWTIIVSGRNEEAGKQVVDNITSSGGSAIFHPVDVTSHASVQALHNHILSTYGRLDAAVNNAGMSTGPARLHDMSTEDFDKIYEINQRGVFWCMQEQIKIMLVQEKKEDEVKRGVIVNMSSMAGVRGLPFSVGYAATKHAVNGMTKTAALEYAKDGILISGIAPAGVDSGMAAHKDMTKIMPDFLDKFAAAHPVGRMGKSIDVAKAVDFALENDFLTGSTIELDGGIGAGRGIE